MSPFPEELINRWYSRPENIPGEGTAYWHILLGENCPLRTTIKAAQEQLSVFPGLHMTPLHRLHITTLIAGSADDIGNNGMAEMLTKSNSLLANVPPISITLDQLVFHPEAIALLVRPRAALIPILEAAIAATSAVRRGQGPRADFVKAWIPHVTLCYSTARQPTEPIISALGTQLPGVTVIVEALSLVIQRGAERLWDWHHVGAARLGAADPRLDGA
jgi:2'-5' RNA ligase